MRKEIIEAVRQHAEGHVAKHKQNVEVLMQKPVGIGEHGDVLTEIEKELKVIAEYDDQLAMLDKYFTYVDPLKSQG